ncbi:MAG: hypothetical protein ACREOM_04745, partial [Candidatus Dormibacteraceae bacterium]
AKPPATAAAKAETAAAPTAAPAAPAAKASEAKARARPKTVVRDDDEEPDEKRAPQLDQIRAALADTPSKSDPDEGPGGVPKPTRQPRAK